MSAGGTIAALVVFSLQPIVFGGHARELASGLAQRLRESARLRDFSVASRYCSLEFCLAAVMRSMQPIASVRPLVVTHRPGPGPGGRSGSGLGRLVVGLSLLAGVSITLYRNDVLRQEAHALHQEALYAKFEQAEQGLDSVASVTSEVALGRQREPHGAASAGMSVTLASAVPAPTPPPC